MLFDKYIYKLSPEEFYDFLTSYGKGVEVLSEGESFVEFALYEPVKGLKPVKVIKVEIIKPENVYRPIRVKNLMVLPSWIKPVVIRQGGAFGTGLHESTRLCLGLLQEELKPGWSVLDVGTGTGILAIASKRLGADRVLAIDIDPVAVEECRHNAEENCVEIECLLGEPKDVRESFDLLVANLELDIFRHLWSKMERLFKHTAIVSGLYGKESVREFLSLCGLKPAKIRSLKNWYGLVLRI